MIIPTITHAVFAQKKDAKLIRRLFFPYKVIFFYKMQLKTQNGAEVILTENLYTKSLLLKNLAEDGFMEINIYEHKINHSAAFEGEIEFIKKCMEHDQDFFIHEVYDEIIYSERFFIDVLLEKKEHMARIKQLALFLQYNKLARAAHEINEYHFLNLN